MKNLYLILVAIFVTGMAVAQEEAVDAAASSNEGVWKTSSTIGLKFSQIGLKNWSAGGDPSIAALIYADYGATLEKGKHVWTAKVAGEYGMQKIKGDPFRKNSDRVEAMTKYGVQLDKEKKWYLATLLNARSQFSKTFTFDGDGNKVQTVSKFASPIILEYSLGIDYKPCEHFSLYMSPVAGKTIIVQNDAIAALNLHGNKGKNVDNQFGALLVAAYKQEVYKDESGKNIVSLESTLKLYKDYLAGPAQNIDVDWQSAVNLTVAKYITASVFMHMIWDYDSDTDSVTPDIQRAVQFKDVIGVGVAYTITDKVRDRNKTID